MDMVVQKLSLDIQLTYILRLSDEISCVSGAFTTFFYVLEHVSCLFMRIIRNSLLFLICYLCRNNLSILFIQRHESKLKFYLGMRIGMYVNNVNCQILQFF